MLGLFLLAFLGKKFYELAGTHNRHQWGYAIAGVAAYYLGTFIAGIAFFIFMDIASFPDDTPDLMISLLSIPFGLLASGGLYYFLEKQWGIEPISQNTDILDDDFLN